MKKLNKEDFVHLQFIAENNVQIDKLSAIHRKMIRTFAESYDAYEKESEESLIAQWNKALLKQSNTILKVLEKDYKYDKDGDFIAPDKDKTRKKEQEETPAEEKKPAKKSKEEIIADLYKSGKTNIEEKELQKLGISSWFDLGFTKAKFGDYILTKPLSSKIWTISKKNQG